MFLKDKKTEKFTISSHGLYGEPRKDQWAGDIYSFSGGGFSPKQLAATLLGSLILH